MGNEEIILVIFMSRSDLARLKAGGEYTSKDRRIGAHEAWQKSGIPYSENFASIGCFYEPVKLQNPIRSYGDTMVILKNENVIEDIKIAVNDDFQDYIIKIKKKKSSNIETSNLLKDFRKIEGTYNDKVKTLNEISHMVRSTSTGYAEARLFRPLTSKDIDWDKTILY